MGLSKRDVDHIFERLRSGLVPERGLDAYAVGVERPRGEIGRLLELTRSGEGVFKFLRGGYGCGKTFMARLAIADAHAKNFATSFVVVSDNDLHFHKFDELYRKVVSELATSACPRGALGDVIDRWIARTEAALIEGGEDPDAEGFDDKVHARLGEEVASATRGTAPEDFVRVLGTVFKLKQKGEIGEASALLSWLGGSENVAQSAKRAAGIRGEISSRDALGYLRGIVAIVKAAGYEGLTIVIDEAETILRMRQDVRGKSMNGIRQIIDAAKDYPRLFWVFTGTPEFFDTKRGVAGLAPLHDRVQFIKHGDVANLRQPQLELRPFDSARLKEVAIRLREIYPTTDRARLEEKVTPAFIDQLVAKVSAGLKGDVGVVPRQFLRTYVDLLDNVNDEPDFDPAKALGFELRNPTVAEERIAKGQPPFDAEPGDEKGYQAVDVIF
jgi:hypothetical protein